MRSAPAAFADLRADRRYATDLRRAGRERGQLPGDVGWNTWEAINRIPDPTPALPYNFGWPCYEGTDRGYDLGLTLCETLYAQGPGAVQAPYFGYRQDQSVFPGDPCGSGSSAVSGLAFYQGGAFPDVYDGALFWADTARGCVFVMLPGVDGLPDPSNVAVMHCCETIVDLEIGPNGDLFMLDMFGAGIGGNLIRVSYPPGEQIPNALIAAEWFKGLIDEVRVYDRALTAAQVAADMAYPVN